MRVIWNPDLAASIDTRVPPGAYVAKFYREGPLVVSVSGRDSHPTGAQLIRIVAEVDAASAAGDVLVGVRKNGTKFAEITIAQNTYSAQLNLHDIDLASTFPFLVATGAPSMNFRPSDYLQAEIINTGSASKLTVRCIFDR